MIENSINKFQNSLLFLTALLFVSVIPQAIAQEDKPARSEIYIKAKVIDNAIELRWAPTDAMAWVETRETGYYLLRLEHKKSGLIDSTWLFSEPFKPKSLEELKATVDQQNKYIALAAQAMYGEDFYLSNRDPRGEVEAISMAKDMFQMRFYFALQAADLSKDAADVLTLRWVDKNVTKGATYSYIILNDTVSKQPKIRGGITHIVNQKSTDKLTPQGLNAFSFDKKIELQWFRSQVGDFTMFYVERSDDGGKTFKRLNKDPYFTSFDEDDLEQKDERIKGMANIVKSNHVFLDSIPENYKDYYYRIRGIDAFADVSEPSVPIKVHGIDLTPPPPVQIDKVKNVFENHVLIEWETPKVMEPDMAGYRMKRGHDPQGPFYDLSEQILPKNTTQFLDTSANGMKPNYYMLATEDIHGNYSYSFPRLGILMDTVPPAAPVGLVGIIDTTGLVYLKWPHNKEADLKGYKVYKSYNKKGAFPQVTSYPVLENGYIDTIDVRSLDRRIYYKIVAVDKTGNHSPYSETFTLDKPILNAPTTPVIKRLYTNDFKIYLDVIGSRSEGVKEHRIYRKSGKEPWDSIATIPFDKNNLDFKFVDTKVKSRVAYTYAVEAVDLTGLRSDKSHSFTLKIFEVKPLDEVMQLKADYNKVENSVKLTWSYPMDDNLYFVVYKSVDDGRFRAYESVENINEFIDKNIAKGEVKYAIVVVNKKTKQESKMSETVTVTTHP